MKLVQVALTNFRSVRARQVFAFPEGPGLFYLQGPNGAGKSTIWEAIYWCLFGKTSKGLTAGSVCNWQVTKGTVVELVYDDGTWITNITRTWAPNSWTMQSDADSRPSDLTKDETNPVLSLLRLGFTAFQQCCIMPQGREMFLDLKPDAKAAIFSEVLGLDRWLMASARASDTARDLDSQVRTLESTVATLQGRVEQAQEVDYAAESAAWKEARKQELREMDERTDALLEARRKQKAVVKVAAQLVDELQQELDKALEQAPQETTCSKCGQPVGDHKHRDHVEELKADLRDARSGEQRSRMTQAQIDRELDQLEASYERLQEQGNPWATRHAQAQGKAKALGRDLRSATDRLEALRERFSLAGSWVRWFKDIRLAQIGDALVQLEIEVNSALSSIGLLGWELRFDVDRETGKGTLQRGFSVTVLSPANTKAVPWEVWSGGEAQRLRVATQWGLINLARSHTGTQWPLEVWDEPTDGIEAQGVQDLLEALEQRAQQEQRQIWVVDHTQLGFSGFAGTATAAKGKHGTVWDTSALSV